MLKSLYAGIALSGIVAIAPVTAELHIEQFAPETSVVVISMDGGQAMLDRMKDSSAKSMLGEPMDSMKDDLMEGMSGPFVEMMEAMGEDVDLIEMLASFRGGMAMSVQSDPESYAAVLDMVGFFDLGEHGKRSEMQEMITEQFDDMAKRGELVDIAGEECVFIPAPDEMPQQAGGWGMAPDFSVFSDIDSYLLHKDNMIFFATSMEGMRRALEAAGGEDVEEPLSSNEQWQGLQSTLDVDGITVAVLTAHLPDLVSLMDTSGMAGMMGGSVVAMLGRIDGMAVGFEPGEGSSIIHARGALWMPEGKSGLVGLMSENTDRGDVPAFFATDQLSIGHMNMNFDGVVDWIRSIIRSNPMMQMQMMQGFEQFEPILAQMMDSMGGGMYMASSLSRPIEVDSMHSIYAIECTDTQKFNDSFGMLAADMGMEQRDFQGNVMYVTEGLGMAGGMLLGGGGGATAIALGGSHVYLGDLKGVEECLRTLEQRGEKTVWPEGIKAGLGTLPERPLAGWVVSDFFENMQVSMELAMLQQERLLSEIAEDDPEMAEEIRAEMKEEVQGGMENVQQWAEAFGPMTYAWWSTDDAFMIDINLLESDSDSTD
jgi:hypothetical protein